jgi:predicted AlkP superfamily phosphohydrolase/phosphomutase
LLTHADDETVVLVVSDHGAKRLDGGIRINEWLLREGYLATLTPPNGTTSLDELGIDWSRTVAWGEGGYYSRIFLNVRGREPEGIVDPSEYERVRDELAERIAAIPDELGQPIETIVHKPEDVYPAAKGVPPDLIVHFGDLFWRAVGTVGGDEGIHTFENDTGPDDANHAQEGLLIAAGPGITPGEREGMHLLDVAPTVLDLLGLEIPANMRGQSLKHELLAAREVAIT